MASPAMPAGDSSMPLKISKPEPWSFGRGFASMDPERQGEVVGYVRRAPIETTTSARPTVRSPRLDWMRVQPERDTGNFEGSSSRRGR
jgi:hypothetical protein